MSVRRKASAVIMFRYVSDFSRHLQALYPSRVVLIHFSDECLTQRKRSRTHRFIRKEAALIRGDLIGSFVLYKTIDTL